MGGTATAGPSTSPAAASIYVSSDTDTSQTTRALRREAGIADAWAAASTPWKAEASAVLDAFIAAGAPFVICDVHDVVGDPILSGGPQVWGALIAGAVSARRIICIGARPSRHGGHLVRVWKAAP